MQHQTASLQIEADPSGQLYITVRNNRVTEALCFARSEGYEPFDPEEVAPDFPTPDTVTIYLLDPKDVFEA